MATTLSIDVVALDRASTTFVKMAEQVAKLSDKLDKLDGKTAKVSVDADTGAASAGLANVDRKIGDINGKKARVKVDVDKSLTDAINGFARLGTSIKTLVKPTAIALGTPQILELANVAVAASGSLGVMAGGLTVAAAAGATLKVGMSGLGDAFKALGSGDVDKLNEALGKLAPNAQAFVREVQAIQPAWKSMQLDVQNALFVGLNTTLADLSGKYLPVVRTGMTDVAAEMNIAAHNTADYLKSAQATGAVATIFQSTRESIRESNTLGADFASILLNIGSVGSTFLPQLSGGFADLVGRLSDYVARAKETGNLAQWMQTGLDVVKQLGEVLGNLGSIIWTAMGAANEAGGGLLNTLVKVTDAAEGVVNSAEGYQVLVSVFSTLATISGALVQGVVALLPVLSALAPIVGQVATILAGALGPIITGLVPLVVSLSNALGAILIAALNVLVPIVVILAQVLSQVLSPILDALGPVIAQLVSVLGAGLLTVIQALVPSIGPLVDAIMAVLNAVLPLIPVIAQFLSQMISQMAPILPQIVVLIAQLVQALVPLLPPIVQLISQLLPPLISMFTAMMPVISTLVSALGGALVGIISGAVVPILTFLINLLSATLIPVITFLANVFTVAFGAIGAVVGGTSSFFSNFGSIVGSVLNGIGSLASWLYNSVILPAWTGIQTATSAVGDVIGVVFGAVQTAVNAVGTAANWLWTTVIQPVFNFIAEAAKILFAVVVTAVLTPILIAVQLLGPPIMALWNNYVQPAFQAIGDFISMIWNSYILPAFNAIVGFIQVNLLNAWNFLRDTVTMVWTAIQNGINAAWSFIRDTIWTPLITFIQVNLTNAFNFFRDLAVAAWNAIRDGLSAAWQWIQANVLQPLVDFYNGPLTTAFNVLRDIAVGAWNAIKDGIAAAYNAVKTTVFDPLVNLVTKTIPDAFNNAVGFIGRAWDAIKGAVRDPIQAVIDVVYNRGIVAAWNKVADFVGLGGMSEYQLPAYAEGGPIRGGIPNKDSVPIMAMGGEYVLSKRAVERAGGVNQIDAWHQALKAGAGGSLGLSPGYVMYGGDEGGPGLAYGRVGMAAGGAVDQALAYARAQNGKPYQWAGVGNPSFDCSGFMSAIQSVLMGQPVRRLYSTAAFASGQGAAGMVPGTGSQFVIGVEQGNPGHMAGNLAGVPVESNGRGVTVGSGRSPMSFPAQFFLPQVGGEFVDSGGGGIDPLAWLTGLIGDLLGLPDQLAGGTPWADIAKGFAGKTVQSVWDFLLDKAKSFIGNIVNTVAGWFGGGNSDARAAVQSAASAYGWNAGPQWDALQQIVQKESSWNPNAQNPGSTAYGLFQFLDSTWGSVGASKTSDPGAQAAAGMRYIQSRYGTPAAALAFHNSHGYYANGGLFTRPTFGVIGEAGPEVVVPANRPDRAASLLRQANLLGVGAAVPGDTSPVEERLDRIATLLERNGAGANITVQDVSGDPAETARRTVLRLRMI